MLTPVLALVCWTLIIWLWMYATRLPAMKAAKINPQDAIHPGSLSVLPANVRVVADNYNHLHESPTIFYALAIYTHLAGAGDQINIWFAWAYVVLRIIHSVLQIVVRQVPLRFFAFALSTACLMVIAVRDVLAL